MIEVKLENKVCEIKTDAKDITLNEMLKCEKLLANKDNSELDNYVNVIQVLSNLTVEEIEDLPMATLKEVMTVIASQNFSLEGIDFVNEFELEGVKYKSKSVSADKIKINVKEIFVLRGLFKKDSKLELNLTTVAGVLFREVDEEGNISRDLSDEAILHRSTLLGNITIDVILPYLNDLKNHLN